MTREELKEQIDELMQQYANEEIDGDTYAQKMMELTTSAQNDVPILRHQSGRIEPYRVRGCTTSGRYVRILDFRHFERHMMFSQSDRKTYKKAISDGVNVSVVLDVGCGNT